MSVSALQSGYQMLHHSTQMVDESSRELNQAQIQSDAEANSNQQSTAAITDSSQDAGSNLKNKSVEKSPDTTDALLKLQQASQYSRAGSNVIQRDQDMIGSLLDVHI